MLASETPKLLQQAAVLDDPMANLQVLCIAKADTAPRSHVVCVESPDLLVCMDCGRSMTWQVGTRDIHDSTSVHPPSFTLACLQSS